MLLFNDWILLDNSWLTGELNWQPFRCQSALPWLLACFLVCPFHYEELFLYLSVTHRQDGGVLCSRDRGPFHKITHGLKIDHCTAHTWICKLRLTQTLYLQMRDTNPTVWSPSVYCHRAWPSSLLLISVFACCPQLWNLPGAADRHPHSGNHHNTCFIIDL